MVGLTLEEPADAAVVAGAPEEENHGKDGHSESLGQEVQEAAKVG
jgi:hypothetical protein